VSEWAVVDRYEQGAEREFNALAQEWSDAARAGDRAALERSAQEMGSLSREALAFFSGHPPEQCFADLHAETVRFWTLLDSYASDFATYLQSNDQVAFRRAAVTFQEAQAAQLRMGEAWDALECPRSP
jgi:hypothetical protein